MLASLLILTFHEYFTFVQTKFPRLQILASNECRDDPFHVYTFFLSRDMNSPFRILASYQFSLVGDPARAEIVTPQSDGAMISAFPFISTPFPALFLSFYASSTSKLISQSPKMTDLKPPQTTASKLRAMLARDNEIVVCPGVYDGFTARLALNAGFKILYMA